MSRINLTISSELFDNPDQEASVRANLQVRTLIEETIREFNLPDDVLYSLRNSATGKVLDPDKTIDQQGIQAGAKLSFVRERRAPLREVRAAGTRANISGLVRAFLREDASGTMFDITFQPAIIGRSDHTNPASADSLAINLDEVEGAKSVSRYHARITEERGMYFIESMAEHNPVYLNNDMVSIGEKRRLNTGDRVRVGRVALTFGTRAGSTTQYQAPNPAGAGPGTGAGSAGG